MEGEGNQDHRRITQRDYLHIHTNIRSVILDGKNRGLRLWGCSDCGLTD